MPDKPHKPLLDFMLIGAQKSGTTALAFYLSQHPEIVMSEPKEPHIFDTLAADTFASAVEIDARYSACFAADNHSSKLKGEATPVYMFLENIPQQLARYNPKLKLLVVLRDPVERAISHYYMEKERGNEHLPLWLALVLEKIRLGITQDPRALNSAQRMHSYRSRGLYSFQLTCILKCFARENLLILSSQELEHQHETILTEISRFLDISEHSAPKDRRLFTGKSIREKHFLVRILLKLSYWAEYRRLSRNYDFNFAKN